MILVINTGSSSVKIALLEQTTEKLLAEGFVDRLGENNPSLIWSIAGETITKQIKQAQEHHGTYQRVMSQMLDVLLSKIDCAYRDSSRLNLSIVMRLGSFF